MCSEPTSHLRENNNKKKKNEKELFLKMLHHKHFLVMLNQNKDSREFSWAGSKILDHGHSLTEAATTSCSLKPAVCLKHVNYTT